MDVDVAAYLKARCRSNFQLSPLPIRGRKMSKSTPYRHRRIRMYPSVEQSRVVHHSEREREGKRRARRYILGLVDLRKSVCCVCLKGFAALWLVVVARARGRWSADLRRRGGELGHGLGALRHGVLGEFSGEEESHGGLDLAGGEGGLLGVSGQLGGLEGESLEDVVDERVQDGHASLGDAGVGVHLLEHLVDVRGVRLDALGLALLVARRDGLLGLLGCLLSYCGCLGHLELIWLKL